MALKDLHRMERLLSEAREISRLDIRMKEEKLEKVNPVILLSHLIESFKLRTDKVAFSFHHPEIPLDVYASPERLSHVFENILDNAVSFSPENSTVEISINKEQDGIAIAVTDQGPGIPEENINQIFDRFFSFRLGDGKKGEHTGLGLSIAKVIVEGLNGSIHVKNVYDNGSVKGASFIVKLPFAL
jgi:two-component system sensor histidine kinase ChvG